MISKIWSEIMLKLTRLLVRLDTARDAVRQAQSITEEIKAVNKETEPATEDLDFWEVYSND